jgi:membrane-bound serine protease (ClpP class)
MIDEGLYESIKRRVEAALEDGANYIILEMDTFGGRVDSAIAITNYLLHEVATRAYTVAYVPTEAYSAGALISVACNDIIMKKATKLGDCAPIVMGGKLEGTEREKVESPLRAIFEASAKANGYPIALCKAMVTMSMEVWQVQNLQSGQYEYFEKDELPNLAPYVYDLDGKKKVVKEGELLTVDADKALEYGLARAVVDDFEGVLQFLEQRDDVKFERPVARITTNWSEELVRWLASPTVAGILFMVALLGIYAELNSPGLGLPGAVAVIALVILFGSKYLIGLANWWEIAVFVIGLGLLIVEIFVIPGFGVAGISGIILIIFALGAMMVGNQPNRLPIPMTEFDWELFRKNMIGTFAGFIGFLIGAYFIGKHLHKIPIANKLVLAAPEGEIAVVKAIDSTTTPEPVVKVGQEGVTLTTLRPAGSGADQWQEN